jgi:hypothetical protein
MTGLTWGSLMDRAPVVRRDVAHQLVQERTKRLTAIDKGKQVESALISKEPVSAGTPDEEPIVSFYTTAKVIVGIREFKLNHVLVHAGSVINLPPMAVLKVIGAVLERTKDLVVGTATSNLVTIDWHTDLDVQVAGVSTNLRV